MSVLKFSVKSKGMYQVDRIKQAGRNRENVGTLKLSPMSFKGTVPVTASEMRHISSFAERRKCVSR